MPADTPDTIVVPLTPDQTTIFAELDRQEQEAKVRRQYIATAIVLGVHAKSAILNKQMAVDTTAGTITLVDPT